MPLKFAHICHRQLICTQKKERPLQACATYSRPHGVIGRARSRTQGGWFPVLSSPADNLPSPERQWDELHTPKLIAAIEEAIKLPLESKYHISGNV